MNKRNQQVGFQVVPPGMWRPACTPSMPVGDAPGPLGHFQTLRMHGMPHLLHPTLPANHPISVWNIPRFTQLPNVNYYLMNSHHNENTTLHEYKYPQQPFHGHPQMFYSARAEQLLQQIAYAQMRERNLSHLPNFPSTMSEQRYPFQTNQHITSQEPQITSQDTYYLHPFGSDPAAAQLGNNQNVGPQHLYGGPLPVSLVNVHSSLPELDENVQQNLQQPFTGYPALPEAENLVQIQQQQQQHTTRTPIPATQTNELNVDRVPINQESYRRSGRQRQEKDRFIRLPDVPVVLPDWSPFYAENFLSNITIYASKCLKKWYISHPMGNVAASGDFIECCFFLNSGVTCYVQLTPSKTKFSCYQQGAAYVADEAGVRTCWGNFKSAKAIARSCRIGKTEIQNFKTLVHNFENNPTYPISLHRDGIHFTTTAADFNDFRLNVNGTYVSVRTTGNEPEESFGKFYLRTYMSQFKQVLYCNGDSLRIAFHTQNACLDNEGTLSLKKWTGTIIDS